MNQRSTRPEPQRLPAAFRDWLCDIAWCQAEEIIDAVPLEGGVSSDIWRFECEGKSYCVKRALGRLKVAAVWEAPISRNASEADWMRFVNRVDPSYAPACLANDAKKGMLLMPYLPHADYPLWKQMLYRGHCSADDARAVGVRLAHIHGQAAKEPELLAAFDNMPVFIAIRLEPYLLATAENHPDLKALLLELAGLAAQGRHSLIHGDVSPKNILLGPDGPVFLDAECACWGDPAFDLAFCLNHLLLKRLWMPAHLELYRSSFSQLVEGYRCAFNQYQAWESWDSLEQRVAKLLPALALARVDGKSPVEYLTSASQKDLVRRLARKALAAATLCLEDINAQWGASGLR
ncbi:MAG: aminoglycoside phosphotransferase family protein [Betaproteobacteria bacterium]|nr:aminoglycoside phosphotransferase family protein [Betaproteobacteria bacterium]